MAGYCRRQQQLHHAHEGRIDVGLPLIGDRPGSLYAPFTSRMRTPSAITRRTSSSLRFSAAWSTTPMFGMPCCHSVSKIVERHLRIRRALHVDADEELVALGRLEDAAQIVDAGGAIDVESELRQLERDVAADARRDDRRRSSQVLARRARRLRRVATLSPR